MANMFLKYSDIRHLILTKRMQQVQLIGVHFIHN